MAGTWPIVEAVQQGPTEPTPERTTGSETSARDSALAVRSLTPELAGRAQAYLFASGGIVGAIAVLLPHPERFDQLAMLAVQVGSIMAAVVLVALGDRAPGWLVAVGPFCAAVLTSVVIVFSGSAASPFVLFYLWVAFYAFYFLRPREALALAVFAVLSYVAVVIVFAVAGSGPASTGVNEAIPMIVLLAGTVATAGVFILLLRERVGRLIAQLTDAARTDPLTGLLNRRGFHRVVDTELERCARGANQFSLLLGDCDFFKHLNDQLGHDAGDRALEAIGTMLEEAKRRIDVAARLGGEEFALVLPETDQHEAFMVAERIRSRFAALFADGPVPLTMSLGVATYPVHGATADDLLRAADQALYAAKTLGRDRSVLYSSEVAGILSPENSETTTRDRAHMATMLSLAEALDTRDTGTARHSQTVGRLCELMARELGFQRDRVERVRVAGVLHDIGKIGVPDSILRKSGPLSESEMNLMKRHPEIAGRILGGSGLDDIRAWIVAHHERPDGNGYPRGLAGDDIPIEARILAVADAFEAMTSDRVYRAAIGADAARRELRAGAGTQFDAGVVDAFLSALDRGWGLLPSTAAGQRRSAASRRIRPR